VGISLEILKAYCPMRKVEFGTKPILTIQEAIEALIDYCIQMMGLFIKQPIITERLQKLINSTLSNS
jgi:hypothetical protein